MFTDKSYYIADIHIPVENLQDGSEFYTILERVEKKILIEFFGYDLYKQFVDGLAEATPDQKWVDIRNGAEYEVKGIKYNWIGLQNTDLVSMLSYFVYDEYVRLNNADLASTGGSFLPINENSERVDSWKSTDAYNKGLELFGFDWSGSFGGLDFNYTPTGISLYDFIYTANKNTPDTYTNWQFTNKAKRTKVI